MRFFTLKCYFKRVKTSVILDSGKYKIYHRIVSFLMHFRYQPRQR